MLLLKSNKRSFFTLIELLVVIFILSLGVVLTGVKLKEAFDEQRFLSESQQVLSNLALAQDMMLILDADVQFNLAYNRESAQFDCWLEVEKPLKKVWSKLVERKLHFQAIKAVVFDDQSRDELKLNFSLSKMSKGKLLLLNTKEGAKQAPDWGKFEIDLLGHPSSLIRRSKEEKWTEDLTQEEQLYPHEIYDEIYKNKMQVP